LVAKKAIATLFYGLGNAFLSMLGKIFAVSRSLAYRWIRQKAAKLSQPVVDKQIKAMELDEM